VAHSSASHAASKIERKGFHPLSRSAPSARAVSCTDAVPDEGSAAPKVPASHTASQVRIIRMMGETVEKKRGRTSVVVVAEDDDLVGHVARNEGVRVPAQSVRVSVKCHRFTVAEARRTRWA